MAELKGTSVVGLFASFEIQVDIPHAHISLLSIDKLGKDQAEKDYHEKIVPAIQVCSIDRTDLGL